MWNSLPNDVVEADTINTFMYAVCAAVENGLL